MIQGYFFLPFSQLQFGLQNLANWLKVFLADIWISLHSQLINMIEEMNLKEIIEIENLLFYLVFSLKSPKGLENIFCKAKS